jgi:2,3-bisphosphoglycerate-independent phosphoglycerate mutase
MTRLLILFLDGVGVGPMDPAINAFAAAPPGRINGLIEHERATLVPLEATLGVPGLPQSGTGQFSLFTGENGAAQLGRHFGPWVPTVLRDRMRYDNLLIRARALGCTISFANAYPEELITATERAKGFRRLGLLRTGLPLVALGAGVLTRHVEALRTGDAVSSDLTNEGWRRRGASDVEAISNRQAGKNLARIANRYDVTLFAHYYTDAAGHDQDLQAAIAALQAVDELVGGVIEDLSTDATFLIVSDHGNLEDANAGHTLNPAFGLVAGAHHEELASRLRSITDIHDAVLEMLGRQRGPR